MSNHHRQLLIKEAFCLADQEVGPVFDLGHNTFAYAFAKPMAPDGATSRSFHSRQEANEVRECNAFQVAARHLEKEVGFEDPFYSNPTWNDAWRHAKQNMGNLESQREIVMSEWIDQHPHAQPAVDAYCAKKAKQDLSQLAQSVRPQDSTLATVEEVQARRSHSRRM